MFRLTSRQCSWSLMLKFSSRLGTKLFFMRTLVTNKCTLSTNTGIKTWFTFLVYYFWPVLFRSDTCVSMCNHCCQRPRPLFKPVSWLLRFKLVGSELGAALLPQRHWVWHKATSYTSKTDIFPLLLCSSDQWISQVHEQRFQRVFDRGACSLAETRQSLQDAAPALCCT